MAYIYGPTQPAATYKGIRVYIDYSTSQTETTFTLTIKAGFQAYTQAVSNTDFQSTYQMISHANHNVPGLSIIQKTHTSFKVAKGAYYQTDNTSVTISKTSSATTYTLRYYAGAGGGTSYPATLTFTVPALRSYSVTFNANGGTGAPAAQTKYYNHALTLSTTKPTRTGYAFVRWNTKADGTGTSYNPGASYTTNAALALYAIWEWVYIAHRISNLSAVRCDSSGTPDDSGTYCKVTFNWTQAILETGPLNPSAIQVGFKLTTDTDYTYVNVTDLTSGTASIIIGNGTLLEDNAFDIIAIVKATGHPDVTAETYLSSSYFCIDVSPNGRAVAFGRSAPAGTDGVFFGLPPFVVVDTTAAPTTPDGKITSDLAYLGWSDVIINKVLDTKSLIDKILKKLQFIPTTIYNTRTECTKVGTAYEYTTIREIANWNIIGVQFVVHENRQILWFPRPIASDINLIDIPTVGRFRGSIVLDWANTRIGIRCIAAPGNRYNFVYFNTVYGL